MKDKNEKVREPFPADETPTQPDHAPENRVADPSPEKERNEEATSNRKKGPDQHEPEQKEKPKLLGESETEIEDETTI